MLVRGLCARHRANTGTLLTCAIAGILFFASSHAEQSGVAPVTEQPWQEAVVSVSDIDRTGRFFLEIGEYEAKWRGPLDPSLVAAWELPEAASARRCCSAPPITRPG